MGELVKLLKHEQKDLANRLSAVTKALGALNGTGRGPKPGRRMTAAHRVAVKRGWARRKKGHQMSAAGRKTIAEAQRKRWRKVHAAKKAA